GDERAGPPADHRRPDRIRRLATERGRSQGPARGEDAVETAGSDPLGSVPVSSHSAYETGTDPSHLGAPVTSRERGQGRLARQSSLAQGLGRKPGSSSIRFIQRATWLYGSSSTPPSGDSTT